MNADILIAEIQKLPPEDVTRVGLFLDGYRSDIEADMISEERATELAVGVVQGLTYEEVFGHPSAPNEASLSSPL